jgi:hypothetical protein
MQMPIFSRTARKLNSTQSCAPARAKRLGSARLWRAGFGVPSKRSFLWNYARSEGSPRYRKVREREDAFASTRDGVGYPEYPNLRVLIRRVFGGIVRGRIRG